MRNTLPASHTAANTPAMPIAIDSAICHSGGGLLDDSRSTLTSGLTGGIMLSTVARVPLGSGCRWGQ